MSENDGDDSSFFYVMLEEERDEVMRELGIEMYSREFFFGGEEAFCRARSKRVLFTPSRSLSLLETLIRYGLDVKRKHVMFPDAFHLGCTRKIPKKKLKVSALITKLRDDYDVMNKDPEALHSAIKRLTGRRALSYPDKQLSLRVLYLLMSLSAKRRDGDDGHAFRLMTLIKKPEKAFEFERRAEFPTPESRTVTYLWRDLRTYLSIELDAGVVDEICNFYDRLIDRVDVLTRLTTGFAKRRAVGGLDNIYREIRQAIGRMDPLQGEISVSTDRLDMDLYIHMHRAEFLHYAGAMQEAGEVVRAMTPIRATAIHTNALMFQCLSTAKSPTPGHEARFRLDLVQRWSEAVRAEVSRIVRLALDLPETWKMTDTLLLRSVELLYRAKMHERGMFIPKGAVRVSLNEIVAGIIAVADEMRRPTRYQVRNYGQANSGRSIKSALDTPFEELAAEPPEGVLRVWHERYRVAKASITGSGEVEKQRLLLQEAILAKVAGIVGLTEIAATERALRRFEKELEAVARSG